MFKSEKSKRTAIISGVVFVVIYAILYLLIQAGYSIDTFSSIWKTILSVLAPVIVGGLIAYLLNPFLRFFERKIFKNMTRPRLRRGLSVFLTYLLVLLILIGIFSAILPQVISSVQEFGSNIENYATAMQTAVAAVFDDLNAYIDEHPSVRDLLESMRIYDWIGKVIEEDSGMPDANLPPYVGSDGALLPPTDSITDDVTVESEDGTTAEGSTTGTSDTEPEAENNGTTDAEEPTDTENDENTVLDDAAESGEESGIQSETDTVTEPSTSLDPAQKHELSFEAFSDFIMEKLSSFSTLFADIAANLANSLLDLGFAFVNFLKNAILGIFISIYLLLSKERVAAQCKRFVNAFFPKKASEEILRIAKKSDHTVGRFLLGTIIDAVIVAVVTLILLTFCDIKYALLISLIIGITNMIPFFGPFIGAIPSAILLLIDDITMMINYPDEPVRFSCITFIILILVIQQIDGNIINPRVIGNSTGLSSLGVILSVTVMSGFFGFFGMLLGVPVAAIIISIGKEITEKLLKKKNLPVTVAEYYPKDSAVPPETPEEEQEHHEHTAFYRGMMSVHEKLRHIFRKILYRNRGESRSLRVWVKMKLGVRNVRHKVNHTIHPDHYKHDGEGHEEKIAEDQEKTQDAPASDEVSSETESTSEHTETHSDRH